MRPGDFFRGIRSTHAVLDELRLLQHPQSYGPLEPSEEFRRLAFIGNAKYPILFVAGLRNRDFNFLLQDFSYFQFYFEEDDGRLELRYAFYPNPFELVPFEDFCESYDIDAGDPSAYELYLQYLEGLDELHYVPPFRYEVSYRQYRPLMHPTAHLHIGLHKENRWPVDKVLTPTAFAMLISKMFYGSAWAKHGERVDALNEFDRRLMQERAECLLLGTDHFSDLERQLVHVT